MSTRTPLSKVQGLGAAHSGVEHFWRERVTAAALVPLTAWFVYAVFHLIGVPYENVIGYLGEPLHAVLLVLFLIASLIHMTLGMQVVIEDYVHKEGSKIALLLFARAFSWAVGAACLFAIAKIAL